MRLTPSALSVASRALWPEVMEYKGLGFRLLGRRLLRGAVPEKLL